MTPSSNEQFNQNYSRHCKMLAGLVKAGIQLPEEYPEKWVVDCQSVGSGDMALVYLGRYLYRGVIREKDILTIKDGEVTFRYQDSKTKKSETRTVSGAHFLWLILQHVLPSRFRRTRDYGFIHPNSKALIQAIHLLFKFDPQKWLLKIKPRPQMRCECCGARMRIIQVQIKEAPDIKVVALNKEDPLGINHLLAM